MDPYSSGEDLVIKTRKPYTITKQRERWTEEEHNRFLEALKLYGRAWQRIEEHIGTKTAVQIRSHAQKFFTKLEKEATVKGVPIGHALDIDIPPPRPKRKPTNPYPRKKCVTLQVAVKNGNTACSFSSSCHSKLTIALEKEPREEPNDDEKSDNSNNDEHRIEPGPSLLSKKQSTFTQYVPLSQEASNLDGTAASQITVEACGMNSDHKLPFSNVSNAIDSFPASAEKFVHCEKTAEYIEKSLTVDMQASTSNYPRHVPVHILDGNLAVTADSKSSQTGEPHSHQNNLFVNPTSSAPCENHHMNTLRFSSQPLCGYHPSIFVPIQNQDDYNHSFLHVYTVFSSLIVSALSQIPASDGADRFGATLWPSTNIGPPSTASASSMDPPNPTPSMAAIAAATVAAATAWWAAHGLLPPLLCTPFHPSPMNDNQGRPENAPNNPPFLLGQQQMEPESSEALFTMHEQQQLPKSPVVSSSESEASADAKPNVTEVPVKSMDTEAKNKSANEKPEKPIDRSSSGSNTPSGSDAEAGEIGRDEEKQTKEKEVSEDHFSRRCRSTASNMTDSWKEVSEEGRLAFQALFSREILPQSFSPPHNDAKNKGKKMLAIDDNAKQKDENGLQLDLNGTFPHEQEGDDNNGNKEDLIQNMGLGQVKLKARRTGFKPYKRCSMEAKDSRAFSNNNQEEEKGPKRLRIEGEAST